MAYTPNTYSTDGSVRDFNITFPFLRESDVRVTVFDSAGNELSNTADYDVAIQKPDQTFQIRVVQYGTIGDLGGGTALASGNTVTIERVTDISTLITVFQDGASLRAEDINALITQINYALEEFGQNTTSALGKNVTQTAWDATSLRITNLAQPTANNDAIRKVDVDSGIGPDITTVAGIASDVSTLASGTDSSGRLNRLNIEDVADDLNLGANSDITTVATDIRTGGNNHVQTVSDNIADVNTLAGNDTDGTPHLVNIETVAENLELGTNSTIKKTSDAIANVNQVGNSIANVNALAGNDPDGTAHLVNIETVAEDLALLSSSKVKIVADNLSGTNTIQTVADIDSDITDLAPQAANIGTLTQPANLTALQNAQANAQAAQSALAQLNNKYHGSFTNVAGNDAEVLADIAGNSALTLEAGDLYFDSTNSKLRYYDGSNWYNAAAAQVINTTSLQNVGDVNAYVNLNTDDFLKYDGVSGWQNVTPSAVKSALSIATGDVSGLGTAASQNVDAFATGAEGDLASTALQPGDVIDDVTTGGTGDVLSAQQGVVLKGLVDANATAIGTKQATLTTSDDATGNIAVHSLKTEVGDFAGGTRSKDVRQANQQFFASSTTAITAEPGASLINADTGSNTTTTITIPDTFVKGDILTIYHKDGAGTLRLVCSSTGPNNMRINGEASNVSNPTTTGVTIGANTLATVTMVENNLAIIAGSDVA